jgi:hypothetical protein
MPYTSPSQNQSFIPLPQTPEMNNAFNPMEEFEELIGALSPSKSGVDLPDFGVFGTNAVDVATMLLNQPDLLSTPQLLQTPSMVEASPDIELIAPVFPNRKAHQGTPSLTPNLTLTPNLASPHVNATGLYDIPLAGQFGFLESNAASSHSFEGNFDNILQMVNAFGPAATQASTISPSQLFVQTLTPNLPFTPGQLLDTPSVGVPSPLLETPGQGTIPLSATAAHGPKKRASPLSQTLAFGSPTKSKRDRSADEDTDSQNAKKRKHTGTRPGISSAQLLAPGAPAQLKTYLTESATSRKDVPASYKVRAGDLPDDSTINKIVAKRTANRDSARRSRQRKQLAMEQAQGEINYLRDRVDQLEAYLREHGLEPPPEPMRIPPQEADDECD